MKYGSAVVACRRVLVAVYKSFISALPGGLLTPRGTERSHSTCMLVSHSPTNRSSLFFFRTNLRSFVRLQILQMTASVTLTRDSRTRIILSGPSRVNSRTFWRPFKTSLIFTYRLHPCNHKSSKSSFAGRTCKPSFFPVPRFPHPARIEDKICRYTRYKADTSASESQRRSADLSASLHQCCSSRI